jgi:triacylglycerol lipase
MTGSKRRAIAADYAWVLPRYGRPVRRIPEAWATGDRAPVLLIPGVYGPWSFMVGLGNRLNRGGHPVHVVSAIGRNRGAISQGARHGLDYLADHDLRNVRIVAHSKGGLVGKQLMAIDPGDRVDRLIAIATPFAGSDRARYMPVRPLRDLRPMATEIAALLANLHLNARITSIYSRWDAHIPNGSRLEGARNIELPLLGHFRLLDDELVLSTVEREAGMD